MTSGQYDPTSLEGVPEAGRARLAQNKRGLFTSDLSVNEFLLVQDAGFDPLGLVVGSSIYHIGYQQSSWRKSMEMDVLSQAMYEARELAMTRMEEEADALDADGVVGVRLDVGSYGVLMLLLAGRSSGARGVGAARCARSPCRGCGR